MLVSNREEAQNETVSGSKRSISGRPETCPVTFAALVFFWRRDAMPEGCAGGTAPGRRAAVGRDVLKRRCPSPFRSPRFPRRGTGGGNRPRRGSEATGRLKAICRAHPPTIFGGESEQKPSRFHQRPDARSGLNGARRRACRSPGSDGYGDQSEGMNALSGNAMRPSLALHSLACSGLPHDSYNRITLPAASSRNCRCGAGTVTRRSFIPW